MGRSRAPRANHRGRTERCTRDRTKPLVSARGPDTILLEKLARPEPEMLSVGAVTGDPHTLTGPATNNLCLRLAFAKRPTGQPAGRPPCVSFGAGARAERDGRGWWAAWEAGDSARGTRAPRPPAAALFSAGGSVPFGSPPRSAGNESRRGRAHSVVAASLLSSRVLWLLVNLGL